MGKFLFHAELSQSVASLGSRLHFCLGVPLDDYVDTLSRSRSATKAKWRHEYSNYELLLQDLRDKKRFSEEAHAEIRAIFDERSDKAISEIRSIPSWVKSEDRDLYMIWDFRAVTLVEEQKQQEWQRWLHEPVSEWVKVEDHDVYKQLEFRKWELRAKDLLGEQKQQEWQRWLHAYVEEEKQRKELEEQRRVQLAQWKADNEKQRILEFALLRAKQENSNGYPLLYRVDIEKQRRLQLDQLKIDQEEQRRARFQEEQRQLQIARSKEQREEEQKSKFVKDEQRRQDRRERISAFRAASKFLIENSSNSQTFQYKYDVESVSMSDGSLFGRFSLEFDLPAAIVFDDGIVTDEHMDVTRLNFWILDFSNFKKLAAQIESRQLKQDVASVYMRHLEIFWQELILEREKKYESDVCEAFIKQQATSRAEEERRRDAEKAEQQAKAEEKARLIAKAAEAAIFRAEEQAKLEEELRPQIAHLQKRLADTKGNPPSISLEQAKIEFADIKQRLSDSDKRIRSMEFEILLLKCEKMRDRQPGKDEINGAAVIGGVIGGLLGLFGGPVTAVLGAASGAGIGGGIKTNDRNSWNDIIHQIWLALGGPSYQRSN